MFVCVSSHIFAMSLLSNHLFLNNEIYEGKYSDLKLINKLRDRYCEIDLYLDIFSFRFIMVWRVYIGNLPIVISNYRFT